MKWMMAARDISKFTSGWDSNNINAAVHVTRVCTITLRLVMLVNTMCAHQYFFFQETNPLSRKNGPESLSSD